MSKQMLIQSRQYFHEDLNAYKQTSDATPYSTSKFPTTIITTYYLGNVDHKGMAVHLARSECEGF